MGHDVESHPDNNVQWEGKTIPDFQSALQLVKRAHLTLSPGVPMIGWDVAFTTQGVLLLEANYSCNFFRGTFDQCAYFRLVDAYMFDLEKRRSVTDTAQKSLGGKTRSHTSRPSHDKTAFLSD